MAPALIAATVILLAIMVGAVVLYKWLGGPSDTPVAGTVGSPKASLLSNLLPHAKPADADITDAVSKTLASAACSWIDHAPMSRAADGRWSLTLSGAAGDPAGVAGAVRSTADAANQPIDLNPRGVLALAPSTCETLDAFRAVRLENASAGDWITPQATEFHPQAHAECRNDATQAMAVIEGQLGKGGDDDVALFVMAPNGELRTVFTGVAGLADFKARAAAGALPGAAARVGKDRFSVNLCHRAPGPYGVLLVRGQGPFDLGLSQIGAQGAGPQPGDFATRFERAAKINNWRTQMGWYQIAAAPVPGSFTAPPSDAFPSTPPATPTTVSAPAATVRTPYRPAAAPPRRRPRIAEPAPARPPPPPPKPVFKPVPLDRS